MKITITTVSVVALIGLGSLIPSAGYAQTVPVASTTYDYSTLSRQDRQILLIQLMQLLIQLLQQLQEMQKAQGQITPALYVPVQTGGGSVVQSTVSMPEETPLNVTVSVTPSNETDAFTHFSVKSSKAIDYNNMTVISNVGTSSTPRVSVAHAIQNDDGTFEYTITPNMDDYSFDQGQKVIFRARDTSQETTVTL